MSAPAGAPQSRIAAHTMLSLVAVLALGLTRFVFAVLVKHELGFATLGRVNTQLSIATFVSLVFASSTSIAAQKFVSAALGVGDQMQARRALLTLLRWCAIGTAAAAAVLAVVLGLFFPKLSLTEVAATCVLLIAYSGYLFIRGAQYGYGTVRRNAVIETVCDVIAIAATVVVVVTGSHLLLLVPFIVGYTLFVTLGWLGLPRPSRAAGPAPALPPGLVVEMRGYSAWAAAALLASTGFLQLSAVFAYKFSGEYDAGLYATAFNLTVPAFFVPRAVSMALFPAMAGAFGRGDTVEVTRQLDAGTRFLLVGGLPFFAAGVFFAKPILMLLFGADAAGADLDLELLLTATYVMIVAIPAVNALSATHHHLVRVNAAAAACGLVTGLIAWVILGPVYGTTGIASGYLIGVIVASAIGLISAWRRWDLGWSTLMVRAGAVVAVAVGVRVLAGLIDNGLLVRAGCTLIVTAVTAAVFGPESRQILRRFAALWTQVRSAAAR